MGDLETEHDYLLEREGDTRRDPVGGANKLQLDAGGLASRLVKPEGEASRLEGSWSRPGLCSLLPDPGPCGSQVGMLHSNFSIVLRFLFI
jgi:hypothetical protein